MNFQCSKCEGKMGCISTRSADNKDGNQAIKRRRECNKCGFRITTIEVRFVFEKRMANRREYWKEYKRKERKIKRGDTAGVSHGGADEDRRGYGGRGVSSG